MIGLNLGLYKFGGNAGGKGRWRRRSHSAMLVQRPEAVQGR